MYEDSGFIQLRQVASNKEWIIDTPPESCEWSGGMVLTLSAQFVPPAAFVAAGDGAWPTFTIVQSAPPGGGRPIVVDGFPGGRIHLPAKRVILTTGIGDPDAGEPDIIFAWSACRGPGGERSKLQCTPTRRLLLNNGATSALLPIPAYARSVVVTSDDNVAAVPPPPSHLLIFIQFRDLTGGSAGCAAAGQTAGSNYHINVPGQAAFYEITNLSGVAIRTTAAFELSV
jgi:hypothetical protein